MLGEGGFGKVMLMQHTNTGQNYAIKYVDARKYGKLYESYFVTYIHTI